MRPSSAVALACVVGIVLVLLLAPLSLSPHTDVLEAAGGGFDFAFDWPAADDRYEAADEMYRVCIVELENGTEREFRDFKECGRFASDRGLINESSPWYYPSDGEEAQP